MDVIQPCRGSGWYDEERHDAHAFRWIARRALCRVRLPSSRSWLRVVSAHLQPDERRCLSVSVNGRRVGSRVVTAGFSTFLFPLEQAGEVELALSVDPTFVPPGDPRELGVMIRSLEVLDLAASDVPVEGEGWHEWEAQEYFPFRWMGARAQLVLPPRLRQRGRFAALPVCSDVEDGSQVLELWGNGGLVARLPLLYLWHVYDIELPGIVGDARSLDLTLSLNRLLPEHVQGFDTRELGVRIGMASVHDDARRHRQVVLLQQTIAGRATSSGNSVVSEGPNAAPNAAATALESVDVAGGGETILPSDGEGWHAWEFRDPTPFRWTARQARLRVAENVWSGHRYLAVPIYSEYANLTQVLTVTIQGHVAAEVAVLHRWHEYNLVLPEPGGGDLDLTFSVNKVVPPAYARGDSRELGVRVGRFAFHDDETRCERSRWFYENVVRNGAELDAGATTLESYPVSLGIDLFAKCNIKPPCVYCPWERMKSIEGEAVDAVVDEETFEQYGSFFAGAGTLVNCSFGEPLLNPRFGEILAFFARRDKTVEISTNGQAFTPATLQALAGKPVKLYVSLDSASPETYARLRSGRWHDVLAGLIVLREMCRRNSWLPTLHMVFMPMRANVGDLEAFVKLCRMVDADSLMLRPLQLENPGAPTERGGYRYDYETEQLGPEELAGVFDDCDRWSRQHGVTVVKQFDFGKTEPERRGLDVERDS